MFIVAALFPYSTDMYWFRPDIKRLTEYWKNGFDWRHQEEQLNHLPQFKTKVTVDGFGEINMHFVHQKSEHPNAIPLLFVHGCKSSFSASST
jgi:hypothetical protein